MVNPNIKNNEIAELIQYDNPHIILIRDNEVYSYNKMELIIVSFGE